MRLTPLDERMNADIDALIAKLEAAKTSRTYLNVPALWARLPNNAKVMNFIGKIDFTV